MKVELLGVLEQIEITAQSHDRTSKMYQKNGCAHNYMEFAARASALRIMANSLETIYSIKGDK